MAYESEKAVESGDTRIVKLLVESGADLKLPHFEGILIAVKKKDINVLQLLLENGASVEPNIQHGIEKSSSVKNYEIAERLLMFSEDKVKCKTLGDKLKFETGLKFSKTIMCLIGLYQKYDAYNDNAELDDFYEYMDLYEKIMTSTNSKKKNIANVCASYFATLLHPSCNNKSKRACYDKVVEIIEYIVENDPEITFNNTEHCETNESENEKNIELLNDEHYELAKSELVDRNFEMLKLLIENGMSVNSHDSLILRTAYKAGDIDWIDYFISKGAKLRDESDGFEEACESDKVEVLQHWMKNGGVVPKNPEYPCINMACLLGNFDMVKLLVKNGVELSDPARNGIRISCRLGFKKTLKYLLDNNAAVGNLCRYQLEYACLIEDIRLVKTILAYYVGLGVLQKKDKTDTKEEELQHDLFLGHENTVCSKEYRITKILLDRGKPMQNGDLLYGINTAIKTNNIEILKLLLTYKIDLNDAGEIAEFAVQMGNIEVVKLLLENGLSVMDYTNILDVPLKANNIEMVRLLLEHGVKIDKYSYYIKEYPNLDNIETLQLILNYCAELGGVSRLLESAILNDKLEATKLLLKDTTTLENNELDFVFYACRNNSLEILKLLFEKGLKVKRGCDSGVVQTCENNNLEMLRLLLKRNPNLVLKKDYGLKEAVKHGNVEMIKLLIKYGVDASAHREWIMRVAKDLSDKDLIELCQRAERENKSLELLCV
ncbi:putative ankyrin repeat protein [Zancudomyces culisetae]|uniref:Putative ankyrin repeat protein n=1 Tax=Zancudomyces culisetae TaxID=1213189 RepID=A0A1R1PTH8_ZANCU|nr:putative ankyrin repeat protein [Zancudomyces culisetae]|eukprot:OMH84296.1 putative ankyrin repeat protein [Zancudomyces culisetae]